MPNVFKLPLYGKPNGTVRIPDRSPTPPPTAEADAPGEQEIPEEEAPKPRFEPVIPTREELMARCADELEEIRRQAAEQAYSDALAARRGELQHCVAKVENLLAEMQQAQQAYMEKYAHELRFLAIDIAETFLHRKIDDDELALKELVMQTVGRIRSADWLEIEVSDRLTALVDELRAEFQKPEYRGRLSVSPKPVPGDTVRVDTHLGAVDASVSVQAAQLRELFDKEE